MLLSTIVTWPCAGWVTVAIVMIWALTPPACSSGGPATSLASTSMLLPELFSPTDLRSPLAVGASLTGVTVIVNVCAALRLTFGRTPDPLSCALTLTVATPFAFAAVLNVSVPLVEMAGCWENMLFLSLETTNPASCCVASFDGPGEKLPGRISFVWLKAVESN